MAYTDVCAPQLGVESQMGMPGVPQSFVLKAGATNTSATFIGFVGKKDCTGDPNAFALTLTTATCAKLPDPFGLLGFYARLSATDVAVTAASVGGAAYVPIFSASTCIPLALQAEVINPGEGCTDVCATRTVPRVCAAHTVLRFVLLIARGPSLTPPRYFAPAPFHCFPACAPYTGSLPLHRYAGPVVHESGCLVDRHHHECLRGRWLHGVSRVISCHHVWHLRAGTFERVHRRP